MSYPVTIPYLSIVIVSLNRYKYINFALESLRRNTYYPFEVLVYGNKASKRFSEIIHEWMDDGIVTHYKKAKREQNRHIAIPASEMFELASGQYFVFLDDDIYAGPLWDYYLVKESPPLKYQYIAPSLIEPSSDDCALIRDFGDSPENFREEEFRKQFPQIFKELKTPRMPCGNFLMPRDTWKALGGFGHIRGCGQDVFIKAKLIKASRDEGTILKMCTVKRSVLYHFRSNSGNVLPEFSKLFFDTFKMTPSEFIEKEFPIGK